MEPHFYVSTPELEASSKRLQSVIESIACELEKPAAAPSPRLAEARERLQAAVCAYLEESRRGNHQVIERMAMQAAWEACREAEKAQETDAS